MSKAKKEQEIIEEQGKLGEMLVIETERKGSGPRVQFDFKNCPTMTDQSSAFLTDINYLVQKFTPDELTQYLEQRNQYRQEILGHDFSQEPNYQDGLNRVVEIKKVLESMPDEIKMYCKNPLEFVKFLDDPRNQEILIRHKIITPKEIANVTQAPTTNVSAEAKQAQPQQSSQTS